GLDAILDPPATPGHPDQGGQRDRAGRKAAVEGQLAGGAVAADQQPVPSGLVGQRGTVVVQADKGPVVQAVALGALAGRHTLPRLAGTLVSSSSARWVAPLKRTGWWQATAST